MDLPSFNSRCPSSNTRENQKFNVVESYMNCDNETIDLAPSLENFPINSYNESINIDYGNSDIDTITVNRKPSLLSKFSKDFFKNDNLKNDKVLNFKSSSNDDPSSTATYSTLSPNAPNISYSPNSNSSSNKMTLRRQQILEELLSTEIGYIEFLKLLSETYTSILESEPLINVSQVPLVECIEMLILEHRNFLDKLQRLQVGSVSATSYSTSDSIQMGIPNFFTQDSAVNAAKGINKFALNIYLYEEYFSIASIASQLMLKLDKNFSFLKGYERYLEALQGSGHKTDLSFKTLLQKPASRLVKYRMFVENLLKNIPDKDESQDILKIELSKIKLKLNRINLLSSYTELFNASAVLFNKLDLSETSIKIPIESFGRPLLCGVLPSIWKSINGQILSQYYGMVLFKSTLILFCLSNNDKHKVEFVIPLQCCKVEKNTVTEGLYCAYRKSFKLIFEHCFGLYEILFLGFVENEAIIWSEKLSLLTNIVNGPYNFDYSISLQDVPGITSFKPSQMAPTDVSLNRFNELDYNFSNCYFGELVPVELIYVDNNGESILKNDSNNFESLILESNSPKVIFKLETRIRYEDLLCDVWFEELPRITNSQHLTKRLDRNKSLSTIKLGISNRIRRVTSSKLSNYNNTYREKTSDSVSTNSDSENHNLFRKASNALNSFFYKVHRSKTY